MTWRGLLITVVTVAIAVTLIKAIGPLDRATDSFRGKIAA